MIEAGSIKIISALDAGRINGDLLMAVWGPVVLGWVIFRYPSILQFLPPRSMRERLNFEYQQNPDIFRFPFLRYLFLGILVVGTVMALVLTASALLA